MRAVKTLAMYLTELKVKMVFSIMYLKYLRNVASLIPHEMYTAAVSHDILVLKTDQPFLLTHRVQTIKLAGAGHEPKGNLLE